MARTTRGREDRFRLLWSLLAWEGELRNHRVQTLLGLEIVQASRLIAQFREQHPETIEFDSATRRWLPTPGAQVPAAALEDYLRLLDEDEDWYEDGRVDFLKPNRRLFALVRHACIAQVGLETRYSSMSHPKGQTRVLYPHTLVRLMQRWHVRAWCAQRQSYCDFTLGRMAQTRLQTGPPSPLPPDVDWNQTLELRLGAHRALDIDQEQVIRGEYFGGAVARSVRVRRALLHYVINDIRAAVDPKRQQPPEFQLEVLNVKDLKPWLFSNSPLEA